MRDDSTHYDEDFERTLLEDVLDFAKTFLLLSIAIVTVAFFIIRPAVVSGRSMVPTFASGQKGFANILALTLTGLDRGDVVVAKTTADDGTEIEIVKRVVGLPGETVSGDENGIYINGELLDESSYINQEFVQENYDRYGYFNKAFDPVTLGEDEYFLLGDNRPRSNDSRELGPFNQSQIEAKDFFTIYPLNRAGYYTNPLSS